ncbi:MAG: HD domain-containing protein, partial [Verrucomicrobia bacterium]|nr:HD domain-containing protein [Verrucomicrobiota bacterium]
MQTLTLTDLKALALRGETVSTASHVQIERVVTKTTKEGKPYREVHCIDSREKVILKAWSDSAIYSLCESLAEGHCVEISGEFGHHAAFGLEARRWTFRVLSASEQSALFAGPPELRAKQEADFQFILECLESLRDPRLRYVWELFLADYGDRFRRAAAARSFHHARRGGLVEHVAGMMRAAAALATVYPRLHRDLLLSGVLFHDCGKLWENHVAETGFSIEHNEVGELLGHISMGIELVNNLWRRLRLCEPYGAWKKLDPACESVRLHLLHLVASHHGEMAFGSPVLPKTPEALALHYIDNLDAKLEMVFGGYATAPLVAPNIHDRVRPLTQYLVAPLGALVEAALEEAASANR